MRNALPKLLLLATLTFLPGCAGLRFAIDVVPAEDRLVETEVMADDDLGWSPDRIAMIEVSGVIADARRPGLIASGENPIARLTEALHKAEHDRGVKAVILRINSPGGGVNASDIMYCAVRDFRQRSGKPVIVQMGDVAASGGYYLACAGDELVAAPTTITGSIGVIIQSINVSEGMRRIGISAESIISGSNKTMGSPFEPMQAEHRALLQGIVDEFYGNFRSLVLASRPGIAPEHVDTVTDGRVLTGRRAHELGLVDRLGHLPEAFTAAKQRAGLEKARLVKYHRPLEYVGSPYAAAPTPSPRASLVDVDVDLDLGDLEPGFYYLWVP